MIFRRWLAGLLAGGAFVCGCVSLSPYALDLEGKPCDPFAAKDTVATVLIFVSNDCPIANRYMPEIRRLQEIYTGRGVRFWLVHADPGETAPQIREHDRNFNLTIPALRDPQPHLVKLAKAEVTPSAALFINGRRLVYHGRIDDRVTDLQRERPEPARHDLADAIDDVLAGQPVREAAAKAVGCFIPALR